MRRYAVLTVVASINSNASNPVVASVIVDRGKCLR